MIPAFLIIDGSGFFSAELACPVPVIENGQVLQQAEEYGENDILHFRCNRRFKRIADLPSKCTKVGMRAEWSPMPQCERKYGRHVHT